MVITVNNNISNFKDISNSTLNDNNNPYTNINNTTSIINDENSTCTLLIRPFSTQELNISDTTKLRFSTGVNYDIIPIMSVSTFIREWMSVHSIMNHKLMPLTPYILKSAPVVSAIRLE